MEVDGTEEVVEEEEEEAEVESLDPRTARGVEIGRNRKLTELEMVENKKEMAF